MPCSPHVSIVVRTYNEARYIERLLYGIEQQTFRDFEVVVVDSGSTDETVDIALSHGARIVNIPKSEFSFGRSLNRGCEAANGKILVIASGHVYPRHRTWLSSLIEPFSNERVAVSFGKQRGDDRTKFSEHILFGEWFHDAGAGAQKTYFCNNANCAIRKEDWQNFPYDEQLTGLEDLKYARHFFERGREIHYRPDATVAHVHEESWQRIQARYMREAIAMKQIDPTMGFGFGKFVALLLGHISGDCRIAARRGQLTSEFHNIVRFRFRQIWGTYLGYRHRTIITEDMRRRFYYPNKSAVETSEELDSDVLIDYNSPSLKQHRG